MLPVKKLVNENLEGLNWRETIDLMEIDSINLKTYIIYRYNTNNHERIYPCKRLDKTVKIYFIRL